MTEERFASDDGGILYRREGRIAHIIFDRPHKLNAFSDGQVNAGNGDAAPIEDRFWVASSTSARLTDSVPVEKLR